MYIALPFLTVKGIRFVDRAQSFRMQVKSDFSVKVSTYARFCSQYAILYHVVVNPAVIYPAIVYPAVVFPAVIYPAIDTLLSYTVP